LDEETVQALLEHRGRQELERRKPGYEDLGLIFCRRAGTPLWPSGVSLRFTDLVYQLGMPRIPLHGLRHTHATIALNAGVNPKVISQRLGHASIAITLDIYSHVLPSIDAEAADLIAKEITGWSRQRYLRSVERPDDAAPPSDAPQSG
jgi:integrase